MTLFSANYDVKERQDGDGDNLLPISLSVQPCGNTIMQIMGDDYPLVVKIERQYQGDVRLTVCDDKTSLDRPILYQVQLYNQDYDVELPPSDDLLKDWRDEIGQKLACGRDHIPELETIMDLIATLPITDVWAFASHPNGKPDELNIQLARSLTMDESFKLAQLNFDHWQLDDHERSVSMQWFR